MKHSIFCFETPANSVILTLSEDNLVLSALLFILKKSMPLYIAHISSLGWFFTCLHLLLLEKVGCVVRQDTLKHVSNSACVGRAHLLPELERTHLAWSSGFGNPQMSVCVTWITAVHGRECAVHGAPSPQTRHGAESTQCLLGKTQFFSLISQDVL